MRKSRIYAGKKAVAAMMAAVLLICAFPMPAFADNNKINELEDEIKRKRKKGNRPRERSTSGRMSLRIFRRPRRALREN